MQQAVAGGPGEAYHDARLLAEPGQRPDRQLPRHARPPGAPDMLVAAPAGRRPPRPQVPQWPVPQIVIAGAHGGSGVSTLAALVRLRFSGWPQGRAPRIGEMPPGPDADADRMVAAGWPPVPPPGVSLIIAARGTAEGARRAVIAVTALERRGIWPAAVAVVADGAGPEPRQAGQRFDLIEGRAGGLVRVPFAAVLRAGTSPAAARLPRRLVDAVNDLAALAAAAPRRQR